MRTLAAVVFCAMFFLVGAMTEVSAFGVLGLVFALPAASHILREVRDGR